jgi:RNA polymerase sigma factor (TIGR02999 family)
MSENPATHILRANETGDARAAAELLPLVYDELRRLAARELAGERPGQTLSATALVHEAYLRLVGVDDAAKWNGRGHFFAAAAAAMRRILVEIGRRRQRVRHGGGRGREALPQLDAPAGFCTDEMLSVHEVLDALNEHSPAVADLVKLHYFAGLTLRECAAALGTSERSAYRDWSYGRAWLRRRLEGT